MGRRQLKGRGQGEARRRDREKERKGERKREGWREREEKERRPRPSERTLLARDPLLCSPHLRDERGREERKERVRGPFGRSFLIRRTVFRTYRGIVDQRIRI